jgi:hypothetical protein
MEQVPVFITIIEISLAAKLPPLVDYISSLINNIQPELMAFHLYSSKLYTNYEGIGGV